MLFLFRVSFCEAYSDVYFHVYSEWDHISGFSSDTKYGLGSRLARSFVSSGLLFEGLSIWAMGWPPGPRMTSWDCAASVVLNDFVILSFFEVNSTTKKSTI